MTIHLLPKKEEKDKEEETDDERKKRIGFPAYNIEDLMKECGCEE